MSIFSEAVASLKAGKPLLQVVSTAWTEVQQWCTNVVSKAEKDPVLGGIVTTAVADGEAVLNAGLSWADTAAAGELGNFSDEVAGLIVKYGALLIGANPTVAAAATFAGALSDVGTAVLMHETQKLQATVTGALSPATAA